MSHKNFNKLFEIYHKNIVPPIYNSSQSELINKLQNDSLKLTIPLKTQPQISSGIYNALEKNTQYRKEINKKVSKPAKLILKNINASLNVLHNSVFFRIFRICEESRTQFENNPEIQFISTSKLEEGISYTKEEFKLKLTNYLEDDEIYRKEQILNKNLKPLLIKFDLEKLWDGANHALKDINNPDRLRHCLVSLRTIYEYIIKEKIIPLEEDLGSIEGFKRFKRGKKKLRSQDIPRIEKLKHFIEKFQFGILEEFTSTDIEYISTCYSVLCNIHQPDVGLTEQQMKSLKIRTGIMFWFLLALIDLLEKDVE